MTEITKRRTIDLAAIADESRRSEIQTAILQLDGVKRVEPESGGGISVEYNLIKISLQEIEEVIESKGHRPKLGLFGRLKRAFIHYTEQNEFDNATAPDAPCCSNPKLCSYDKPQQATHTRS